MTTVLFFHKCATPRSLRIYIFQNLLIDIDIFQNHLIDIDIDISNLFIDFDIDIFQNHLVLQNIDWSGGSHTPTRSVCVVESQIVLRGTDNCDPFRECATTNWPTMVSRSRNSSIWKGAPGGRLCWNIMIGEAISGGKCSRRKTERDKDTKGALAVWINPTYVVMVITCTEKCDCIILQKKQVWTCVICCQYSAINEWDILW